MRVNNPPANDLSFVSQTVVTGSRALGATYRNTGGTPRLVAASFNLAQTGSVIAYCDTAASPTTDIVSLRNNNLLAIFGALTIIVLPLYYYSLVGGGAESIEVWTEYN